MSSYSLRPMTNEDRTLIWKWRNHPSIQATSLYKDFIPWEEHQKWKPYIAEIFTINNRSAGIVVYAASRYWSFYLDPDEPKRCGLAQIMLSIFLSEHKRLPINAKVFKSNQASINLHKKLGFKITKKTKEIVHFSR